MNGEIHNSCLAVDATDPSALEFSADGFRDVDLHGRRYLLRAKDNGELEVIATPKIARLLDGPELYLNVILLGPPDPLDIYLSPHVAGGRISLSVETSIDNAEIDALSLLTGRKVRARTSENTRFELRSRVETLATIENALAQKVTLEAALSAEQARAVMSALSHGPDDLEDLELESVFHWRESSVQQMHLRGTWSAVFTLAQPLAQARDGLILTEDLNIIAHQGLDRQILQLHDQYGNPSTDTQAVAEMLQRAHALFLRRHDQGFELRESPLSMPLSIKQSVQRVEARQATVILDVLPAIKASMVASQPDKHMNISVLGNRQLSRATLPARRSIQVGNKTIRPGVNLAAGHDLVDPQLMVKPLVTQQLGLLNTNLVWSEGLRTRSLPVIRNGQAADQTLLPDRVQSKWQWYVPAWRLSLQSHDVDDGPYRFEFEQRGVTANAEPAFFATIHFELHATEPAHLKRAIVAAKKRSLTVKQIVPSVLSIYLEIPYVDERNGRVARRRLKATFKQHKERVVCTVQVQHDTVRLAYGALSHPGFQDESARIHIDARFNVYEVVSGASSSIKRATNRAVHQAGLSATSSIYNAGLSATRSIHNAGLSVSTSVYHVAKPHRPVLIKPDVVLRPDIIAKPEPIRPQPGKDKKKYKLTQSSNSQELDLLVPCDTYGQAYRQRQGDSTVSIGCLQPMLLGATSPDLVQELTEHRTASFRVYRQLAQPDRFLVLPSGYHLTRRMTSPTMSAPALGLYSAFDPSSSDDAQFTFDAHLEPSISSAEYQRLLTTLTRYSTAPQLDFPTELDLSEQSLTLLSEGEHSFVTDGPFLIASIRADLNEALIIKARLESSAIHGNAIFTLSDDTRLEPAVISIALNDVGGPWPGGAINVERQNDQLMLTNRTESEHHIVSIELQNPAGVLQLGTVIESGASLPVALDTQHGNTIVTAVPTQSSTPRLNEMRIFSELIRKQVIFFAKFDLSASYTPVIEIRAHLKDIGEELGRVLEGQNRSAEIEFELPLTAILSSTELVYTLVYRNAQGAEHLTLTDSVELSQTSIVEISTVT